MAKDILETIKDYTLWRVEQSKIILPKESVERLAKENTSGGRKFYNAIKKDGVSMICEIKKASPSKGIIDSEFDYLKILSDYEKGGASALSVLTEPKFFMGGNHIFVDIRNKTTLPLLRKDFIVDEYQIYESKALGADAMLLICAMLDIDTLKRFYQKAKELDLDVLVETHNEEEIEMAYKMNADIIGVNSRNLKDFDVSISNGLSLINKLASESERDKSGKLFVLESGVSSKDDIADIKANGGAGALIGETLMRSVNRIELLKDFITAGK